MKFIKQASGILLIMLASATTRTYAQASEVGSLFRDFEARAAAGTPGDGAETLPVLDKLVSASKESVTGDLPIILREASNPEVSVRRVAAFALWEITTRPDGRTLLSNENAMFAALLVDADLPVRRITGMAISDLSLEPNSPLVPVLERFLSREDAVSTIGPGVATILMKVSPDNADSTNAVVQYMRRKDQTSASRDVLMDAIVNVAKSHNREIGKAVANWADDPDEQTSVHAIGTLQSMGKDVVLDSQQSLSRIAGDSSRAPSIRTAATKALANTR